MSDSEVIRELLVSLGVVTQPDSEEKIASFDAALGSLKTTMGKVVQAALGVVSAVIAVDAAAASVAVSAAQNAETIIQQAEALGITTAEYQELAFAMESFSGDATLLQQSLALLDGALTQGRQGAENYAKAFATLGLSMSDLAKMSPADQFEALAEAVGSAEDRSAALVAVTKILGEDTARRLRPMLLAGAEGIRAVREEANALGLVNEEGLERTAELAQSWRKLTAVGRDLRDEIGAAIAPQLTKIIERTLDWVEANQDLIDKIKDFTTKAFDLFTTVKPAIIGVALAFAAVAGAIGAIIAGGALLSMVTAFALANPVVATVVVTLTALVVIIGSLALAFEDLIVWVRGGNSAIGELFERIITSLPGGEKLWSMLDRWADVGRAVVGVMASVGTAIAKTLGSEAMRRILKAMDPVLSAMERMIEYADILSTTLGATITAAFGGPDTRDTAALASGIEASGPAVAAYAAQAVRETVRGGNTSNSTTTTQNTVVHQTVQVGGMAEIDSATRQAYDAVGGGLR